MYRGGDTEPLEHELSEGKNFDQSDRRVSTLRVQVRRAYDDPAPEDGMRILVDRLWPRGVSKERLPLDRWAKELAPSPDLRRWYGHEPEKFEQFRQRYMSELEEEAKALQVEELRRIASDQQITLITATKDVERSGAVVLAEFLRRREEPASGV